MNDNEHQLTQRKQALLNELESIKTLLDDGTDNIPVLNDAIIETIAEEAEITTQPDKKTTTHLLAKSITHAPIAQTFIRESSTPQSPEILEKTDNESKNDTQNTDINSPLIINESDESHPSDAPEKTYVSNPTVLPGQQSLFNESVAKAKALEKTAVSKAAAAEEAIASASNKSTEDHATRSNNSAYSSSNNSSYNNSSDKTAYKDKTSTPKAMSGSPSSLAQNPFLPAHVRQRFEKMPTTKNSESHPVPLLTTETEALATTPSFTEQVVEDVIALYMPKIEDELRQRLTAIVQLHDESLKK